MFLKFYKMMKFLCSNYNYLPNDIKSELVDVLTYYRDLCVISKFEKGDIK